MIDWADEALRVGAALAAGVLIGIERGWHLRDREAGSRVAGIRTFSLLGLAGGLAGLLGAKGQPLMGGTIVIAASAVLVLGYLNSLKERHDATTAVAALVTLTIGLLSGVGSYGLGIAAAAVTVLVLAMREELHRFVERLDEHDVKALARFAVIALGVLPFLPNRAMGPYDAWNPFKLWLVVVLVTGFSFMAYVANRIFGARRGTISTALIGGAYSSTAVTQSLAQRLGSKDAGGAEAAGIALATAVMYLRVIVLVWILAPRLLWPFMLVVAPPLIVAWAAGWWLYRKAPSCDGPSPPGNPIALVPAVAFLLFVAVAAVIARWAEGRFGQEGIAVLLLIMGSMDVDAAIVTAGGLPSTAITAELAALALGGTILANMAVKLGVTLAYARSKGISAAFALGASMVALAASLVV
ncbi:MAG: MgtC/SapB family protein, partial [Sphingomicrobium sp.]